MLPCLEDRSCLLNVWSLVSDNGAAYKQRVKRSFCAGNLTLSSVFPYQLRDDFPNSHTSPTATCGRDSLYPPEFFFVTRADFVAQYFSIMTGRGGNRGGAKTLLAPIHYIFKLLQQRSTVSIWLYEQLAARIEGKIRVGTRQLRPFVLSLTGRAAIGFRRVHESGGR